ncbi:MAG TPA: ABC transporter ATP-binding protein [Methylococcus sp.]|nr:ABC transporter ATP-binding protein [Methylococcus sp.]
MMKPTTPLPLVELRQVEKIYRLGERSITALHAVNLRIYPGEFVAVWGPSGSGKSTLCNLIGMLDVPSAGTVHINGQDVTTLSDNRRSEIRNKSIGFVFQSFNLIPVLSAVENVMLPLQIAKASTAQAKRLAQERLAEVGLAEYASQRPAKLSGGQQQRVAIARALVSNPSLVIADEPTANLDSENAIKIIETMRELSNRNGTTFVFSTHDHRLLERVERQIQMCDGNIMEDRMSRQTESRRSAQFAL